MKPVDPRSPETGSRNPDSGGLRDAVRNHFDGIASRYEKYKDHSRYYYRQLQKLLLELVPDARTKRIVEIGCGPGGLLAGLHPLQGLGIDISPRMIALARDRWSERPELQFREGEAETLELTGLWDAVICVDVLEHLYDVEAAMKRLGIQLPPGTCLIVIWANRFWTPVLHLLEVLRLKMPEGPHKWESPGIVQRFLVKNQFRILSKGSRCLIPVQLPGSDWTNRLFHKVPVLNKLGLIRFVLAVKRDGSASG
ncbi:methyltransferase domain-containing protein [bacterium]|nr:methyltransferase domain-containing protein [candidate division CSSED10-310 bacterium]